jgi:hypothetical protein
MSINSHTTPPSSIILWNANGLKKHANELYQFLRNKNIDLALISETHLTKNTNFKINGYKIIRADHHPQILQSKNLMVALQSLTRIKLKYSNNIFRKSLSLILIFTLLKT